MSTINLDVRDGVAHLTLNRPDDRNSVNLQFAKDLHDATLQLVADDSVRCVLLAGAGPAFCAGGDLKEFSGVTDLASHIREVVTYLHAAIARLDRLDKPIVAAVRGSAAGAGLGLASASDIMLVAPGTKFVVAYTKIGLTPDGSVSWSLVRLVGLRRALDLTLTNRVVDAEEAVAIGIATRVVDDSVLDKEAEELAQQLAAGPTNAFAGARRLLRESLANPLETQMELETQIIAAAAGNPNGKEGIAAFVEKRAPDFS